MGGPLSATGRSGICYHLVPIFQRKSKKKKSLIKYGCWMFFFYFRWSLLVLLFLVRNKTFQCGSSVRKKLQIKYVERMMVTWAWEKTEREATVAKVSAAHCSSHVFKARASTLALSTMFAFLPSHPGVKLGAWFYFSRPILVVAGTVMLNERCVMCYSTWASESATVLKR